MPKRLSALITIATAFAVASCANHQSVSPRNASVEQPVSEVRSDNRAGVPEQITPPHEPSPPVTQSTTPSGKAIPRKFNLTGYPAGFRFGFNAGCDDARHGLTSASDRNRYNGDSLYRSGWKDGFAVCRGKKPAQ